MTAVPQMKVITVSSLSACLNWFAPSDCMRPHLAPHLCFLLMYTVYRARCGAHKLFRRVDGHIESGPWLLSGTFEPLNRYLLLVVHARPHKVPVARNRRQS